MNLTDIFADLGYGAKLTHLAQEGTEWWCELALPETRYTRTLVTASGADPDEAIRNTVERAKQWARVVKVRAA